MGGGGRRQGQGMLPWQFRKSVRENIKCRPFGRWHRHKDLNWYKKQASKNTADTDDVLDKEIQQMKQAEAAAFAIALGGGNPATQLPENPNLAPIGERKRYHPD